MIIVLLGYMGAGKSTLGVRLANYLNYNYIDLDKYIENEESQTITDIFNNKGALYFRKKEATYLEQLINKNQHLVIASGGGTPCYGEVMKNLLENKKVVTVYLQLSVLALTERLWKEKENRPLIAEITKKEQLQEFIGKHLFERAFYYNQSEIIIEASSKTIKELEEEIILKLF